MADDGQAPQLRLTDTLAGEQRPFEPLDPPHVLLYVCGLTVSDDPHLGHARTWVSFDVLHRYLAYLGYDVLHVENVTDVDDKIIAKADEEDTTPAAIAERYSQQVYDDMEALNLRRVEVRPRVTEHVDDIVAMVEALVDEGYAYEADDGVYFDVDSYEDYGQLSGVDLDELEQGEESEAKDDPADFALWKAVEDDAEDEPSWDSPWGAGRPGWHIECSAMSTRHLGDTIDIHGGGRDLVFPHHENEIAQSECATGEAFTRYWLHVGPLRVEGDKMSTSLDNFWTVHDALDEYSPNAIRAFLISTQYAKPQQFSEDSLDEGRRKWERLRNAERAAADAMDSERALAKVVDRDLRRTAEATRPAFEEAMDDDLNTPEALAALFELAGAINSHVDEGDVYDYQGLFRAWATLRDLGGVLGFAFDEADRGPEGPTDELIEILLDVRERERDEGNYDAADRIRDRLRDAGVAVEDDDGGTTYRIE